ncbi:Eco57I restriction-modification methylase domain-containing protein [Salsipaludibacter albus]|uniref:Eco57I restriction-modification methylase domain-containing protein n=1 Tax=Salsipaludibacter albus TaxID=2849650 RepID=UPI001EE481C9|nr:hypothetical protein [Salsipaludibacter albus]MBY5162095.1 hypothetical protein [Salsipaludibacter albus]
MPDGPFLAAGALDVQTVGENWPTRLSAEQKALLTAPPASETEEDDGWDDGSWDGRRARLASLLTELLGYRDGKTLTAAPDIAAHHHIYRARVRADFAVHAPDDPADVRMVVICGPDATDDPAHIRPSQTHNHDGWVSTPVQRAALLARHAGADLALVTNGSEHLLVNVVTGTTGSAMWTVNGLEDRHARDAFVALLHKQRVLHRTVPLSRLIELSQDRQHELTDTLGKQVRRAAEALVNAVSRANRTSRGRLLEGLTGQQVYAATTRVLMRTVFLLVAEERGLLPVAENQLYADQYAMWTLPDKLDADAYRNRSAMERRSGAWQRMMALSRAVHAGIEHDDLRLPAYGGNLFDPDEHPFLEARIPSADGDGFEQFEIGVVDDFTVLTVLRHLQIANGQRISFRSLDVEQIGHVYEALLDHSAVIVPKEQDAVLGLYGKVGEEPEVSLVDMESWHAKSDKELGKQLSDLGVAAEARGVYNAMEAGLAPDSDVAQTLNVAVANDEVLRERVAPYAPLLRTDARGVALVFLPGDVYVTETSSKRDSGTAYTPRSLADEIAKHTLDPLIYDPGPQNEADESKWQLKASQEILDLKICDPAVGSAAILVAAVRYLAEALLQARVEAGELSAEALASGAADVEAVDARVHARRAVVARCVYGVDRDPMAVEMAKLSLWLITMARDAPFSFLDHAIRHGDSLLGIVDLDQLRKLHLEPSEVSGSGRGLSLTIGSEGWWETIDDRIDELTSLRSKLRSIPDDVSDSIHEKERLHGRAEQVTTDLAVVADAVTAAYLKHAGGSSADRDAAQGAMQQLVVDLDRYRATLAIEATRRLEDDNPDPAVPRRPLHWPLAFPEVFVEGDGFDAIVANPPFIKSQGLRDSVGTNYRDYCSVHLAAGRKGKSDFIAYFAWRLTAISHRAGFLSTNSIAQGDTLRVGLAPISSEWAIYRAVRSTPWPGAAGVHISKVWMTLGDYEGAMRLDGEVVPGISASLEAAGTVEGPPLKLMANSSLAYQGYQIVASGLVVNQATADRLVHLDPSSGVVIRPYVNGDDVNGPLPRHSEDRRVIDFGTMTESQARDFRSAFAHVAEQVKPEILSKAAPKPNGKPSSYARWKNRWWQFWSPRPALRRSTSGMGRVLAMARTSKVFYPVFMPASWCLTDALIVFAYDDIGHFGVLTSSFHWWWAVNPPGTGGSSLKGDPRYTPTTSFQTFPQPRITEALSTAAQELHDCRETWFEHEGIGLRECYDRVNNPSDESETVVELRKLHVQLDEAVREAYDASDDHHDWSTLALDHDFFDCGELGHRYTVSKEARGKMMLWLLELNFRCFADEHSRTYESVLRETGNA